MRTYNTPNGETVVEFPLRAVNFGTPSPTYPVLIRTRLTKRQLQTLLDAVEEAELSGSLIEQEDRYTITPAGIAALRDAELGGNFDERA